MLESDRKGEDRCGRSRLGVLHVGGAKTAFGLSVNKRPTNYVRVHTVDSEASEGKIR